MDSVRQPCPTGLGKVVNDLGLPYFKMLADAEKRHRERGIRLWLVGMNPEVLSMIRDHSRRMALFGLFGHRRAAFIIPNAIMQN